LDLLRRKERCRPPERHGDEGNRHGRRRAAISTVVTVGAMRAAVRTAYGPPEVVHITDVPAPEVGPGDVRIAVHATTVNRTDCGTRAAHPFFIRVLTGLVRPRATILGNEFAGVVESVGPRVTRFAVGDSVFGYSPRFGAHAELLSISEDGPVAPIPGGLSFEDVAPSTEGAHYALSIIRKAGINGDQCSPGRYRWLSGSSSRVPTVPDPH
jgi:NADPH:quinone reductase-like Zn-dependent oxidoreductase